MVLPKIGYPRSQHLRKMSQAGQRRNKVTVAQLTLLDILSVETKGHLWFVNNLISRHPITEDVVVPT